MKKKGDFFVLTCYHCGNKGMQRILFDYETSYGGEREPYEQFNWFLLQCPVCKMLSLKQDYTNESMLSYNEGQIYDERIVYPQTKYDFHFVPKAIKQAFESAIKVSKIDNDICLLSLRRTLEMICKNKRAKGSNLEERINDLSSKNILPSTLDDSSWLIRTMGNDAAHADSVHYTGYEVNQIIEFVEQIIFYLYELPERILEMKESRQSRIGRK